MLFRYKLGKRKREFKDTKILALGVYLADKPNLLQQIVKVLDSGKRYKVTQRWVALGKAKSKFSSIPFVVRRTEVMVPKFEIINQLITADDLEFYDYVMLVDDDVEFPPQFIDRFFETLENLNFSLAQPARTLDSYIDHPIVQQQLGVEARQTQFVEIGPVVVFHRSCFELIFPFNLTSPMGWGYENVWAKRLADKNLKMGIIDSVPVAHRFRKTLVNYSWEVANRQRSTYLAGETNFRIQDCYRVINVYPIDEKTKGQSL